MRCCPFTQQLHKHTNGQRQSYYRENKKSTDRGTTTKRQLKIDSRIWYALVRLGTLKAMPHLVLLALYTFCRPITSTAFLPPTPCCARAVGPVRCCNSSFTCTSRHTLTCRPDMWFSNHVVQLIRAGVTALQHVHQGADSCAVQ